jgi:hypothetical protein
MLDVFDCWTYLQQVVNFVSDTKTKRAERIFDSSEIFLLKFGSKTNDCWYSIHIQLFLKPFKETFN